MRVVSCNCRRGLGYVAEPGLGGHPIGLRAHETHKISMTWCSVRTRRSAPQALAFCEGFIVRYGSYHDAISGPGHLKALLLHKATDTRDRGSSLVDLGGGHQRTRKLLNEPPVLRGGWSGIRGQMAFK